MSSGPTIGQHHYPPRERSDAYWQRETTTNGRRINDAIDLHEQNSALRSLARMRVPDTTINEYKYEWEVYRQLAKFEWRDNFDRHGRFISIGEATSRAYITMEGCRSENLNSKGEWISGVSLAAEVKDPGREGIRSITVGQSESGYHYRSYFSHQIYEGYDYSGRWSKAYPTAEIAQRVGYAEIAGDAGVTDHLVGRRKVVADAIISAKSENDKPLARIARYLSSASFIRTNNVFHHAEDGRAYISRRASSRARHDIQEARTIRTNDRRSKIEPFSKLETVEARAINHTSRTVTNVMESETQKRIAASYWSALSAHSKGTRPQRETTLERSVEQ